jgi:hypothetical protein
MRYVICNEAGEIVWPPNPNYDGLDLNDAISEAHVQWEALAHREARVVREDREPHRDVLTYHAHPLGPEPTPAVIEAVPWHPWVAGTRDKDGSAARVRMRYQLAADVASAWHLEIVTDTLPTTGPRIRRWTSHVSDAGEWVTFDGTCVEMGLPKLGRISLGHGLGSTAEEHLTTVQTYAPDGESVAGKGREQDLQRAIATLAHVAMSAKR